MGIINNIGIASDLASMASGQAPSSFLFRFVPIFFHRKKGLSKAQMKKMMMRRRRAFVDNVVMIHERRLHKQNLEDRISKVKSLIEKKVKKDLSRPSSRPSSSPKIFPSKARSDQKFRGKDTSKVAREIILQRGDGKTKIQGLIDNERQKSRSKWTQRVNIKNGSTKEI